MHDIKKDIAVPPIVESGEEVILARWMVKPGDLIEKGTVLCCLETHKSVHELTAINKGMVSDLLAKEGQEVKVGEPIMNILEIPTDEVRPLQQQTLSANNYQNAPCFSPAAKNYLKKMGINISDVANQFVGHAVVHLDDVKSICMSKASEPGRLAVEYLPTLKDNLVNRTITGDSLVEFLRKAGAKIGNNVKFLKNSVLYAEYIDISDDTLIGPNVTIECYRLTIGAMSVFEGDSRFICHDLYLGKAFYAARGAEIGWGGEKGRRAVVKMGNRCFMGEFSMINPARNVEFGERVALGAGSKIYTHQFWQSRLDGYPQSFAPVQLGNNIQIGANCVIAPGTKVNDNCFVLSCSLLAGVYPQSSMIGGVPAKIIQSNCFHVPTKEGKVAILRELLLEVAQTAMDYKCDVQQISERFFKIIDRGKEYEVTLLESELLIEAKAISNVPVCKFNFNSLIIEGFCSVLVFEIIREVSRKFGIIFQPDNWRFSPNAPNC